MTFSDAWIEAGDDDDFATFLKQHPGAGSLPPPDQPYWINHVKEWAKLEGLPVEFPDYNMVRVPVTKRQLQCFMDEMLGTPAPDSNPFSLRGYIEQRCRDDRTYAIAADEF